MNMKTKWIIITLSAVAIVAAAIGIRMAIQAAASPPADQTGPYKVGFVVYTYYDSTRSDFAGGPRPIQTFIWYPAAPDNNGKPMLPAVYPAKLLKLNGLNVAPATSSTDFEAYDIDLAYQEVAASQHGPLPLVIFSPGGQADSLSYVHLGTRLASHGFVVAAPTTIDDQLSATGQPEFYSSIEAYSVATYVERTRDVQYLMTQLVADSQQSGNLFSGTVRADKIAFAGHSLGGLAALALAGGDDNVCEWTMIPEMTTLPPETCVSIQPDTRIKAIVPIDATSYALHYAELARIKIPSMLIGEEWSTWESMKLKLGMDLDFETVIARPHAAIQGHPNYRMEVAYANHNAFTSSWSYIHVLYDTGNIDAQIRDAASPNMCPPETISAVEAENLTSQYVTSFHKTVLLRQTGYKLMLTTDYALKFEPLIEFFETEQGSPDETVEQGYFSYFKHQPGNERATALKDPFLKAP
jgi:hypothetical protein